MVVQVKDLEQIADPLERVAAADETIAAGRKTLTQAIEIRAAALRAAIESGQITRAELARKRGINVTSLDRLMRR